ncbi:hypothetical protein Prum_093070 [Phytohabitans rumicis]|uniref:Esterase n=1 Tax=Phytohabitans rumicis TaxID=1076125 RepID=A0A6V8LSD8_9ACTN|nr:hypothetical protein Prum_093070 [Phytohabitans rumicis]
MKLKLKMLAAAVAAAALAVVAAVTFAQPASAATLTEVTGFGTNPSNLRMYLYVPDQVAARPGLLVAAHYCTGNGPAFYSGTGYANLANQYGFIVIYPSVTRSSACWDVSSAAALRRGGGSDPVGIMSMVDYVRARYPVDANKIFATGTSSGAMMTNVLLGDYPDVFKGARRSRVCRSPASPPPTARSGTANAPTGPSSGPRSSGATWSATRTPATPAPARGCRSGTAPTTRRCATRTSVSRSSSGPTCTG